MTPFPTHPGSASSRAHQDQGSQLTDNPHITSSTAIKLSIIYTSVNESSVRPRMLFLVLAFIYDFGRRGSWLVLRGFFLSFFFFPLFSARATEKMFLIRPVERKRLLNGTTPCEGNTKSRCYYLKQQQQRGGVLGPAPESPRWSRGFVPSLGPRRTGRTLRTRLSGPPRASPSPSSPSCFPSTLPHGERLHRRLPRGCHPTALFF